MTVLMIYMCRCIIQDNKSDWEQEASRMTEVYTGAFVTIAATRSDGGLKGCFSMRDVLAEPVWSSPDGTAQVFARKKVQHETDSNVPFKEPLLKRAWTLQEHLLSKRVIHFCQKEIIWECRTGFACECTPNIEPSLESLSSLLVSEESRPTSIAAPLNWRID